MVRSGPQARVGVPGVVENNRRVAAATRAERHADGALATCVGERCWHVLPPPASAPNASASSGASTASNASDASDASDAATKHAAAVASCAVRSCPKEAAKLIRAAGKLDKASAAGTRIWAKKSPAEQ